MHTNEIDRFPRALFPAIVWLLGLIILGLAEWIFPIEMHFWANYFGYQYSGNFCMDLVTGTGVVMIIITVPVFINQFLKTSTS